ncbi:MAG: S8 family serine peptidase, partial [Phycisphaerae bacterium]
MRAIPANSHGRRRTGATGVWFATLAVPLIVASVTVGAGPELQQIELTPDWSSSEQAQSDHIAAMETPSEEELLRQQAGHEIAQAKQRGLVSVLVYFRQNGTAQANVKDSIRDFAQQNQGRVKYEYTSVMPDVMNLRDIPEGKVAALRQLPGVWKVEIDQYHANVVQLHDSISLIRGLPSQIAGAGYSADGTGVRVCVIDTGIDNDHIMYADRIDTAAGYDFYNNDNNPDDDNGHGAHCAGIVGGGSGLSWDPCGTGSLPFQGVAPNVTLIGAKVLNSGGGGFDSDIIAGINYCADQSPSGGRADIISMSIGTGSYSGPCSHSWAVASNNAAANGVVAIAAAGNDNYSNSLSSPACGADTIAVGMTWKNDYPTCEDATTNWSWGVCTDFAPQTDDVGCFSNESDYLDVAAPGAHIWSADIVAGGTSITGKSGTSMSCPTVAGLAALVLQTDPTLTPAEVRQVIRDGAIDLGPPGFDRGYGYGRIDVLNTLALVAPGCSVNADCNDGNPCTNDTCVSGTCQFTNNSNSCDDGLFCTVTDVCSGGSCVGSGSPCSGGLFCNEANDSCDDVDCIVNGDCDDGNGCTTDTCSGGACTNACASNVSSYPYGENFESGLGGWSNVSGDIFDWTRNSGGTLSNNTGPSGDHTTGSGFYMYTETSSPRQPGDTAILEGPCIDLTGATGADLDFWYHMYGSAIGTLNVEASTDCSSWTNLWSLSGNQGNSWIQASIDLSSYAGSVVTVRYVGIRGSSWAGDISIDDIAVDVSAPQCSVNADCDDGVYCNGAETCNAGTCQSGSAVNCNDGISCTTDSCNESTDSCDNVPNQAACDDGAYCNGVETCSATLGCQSGTPVNCDDGVACTNDSCNESTDSCNNSPDNGNCDDGLFCNGSETCNATLGCQSGSAVNCNDGIGCTDDSCNESTDSCDNVVNNANCDDGVFCNGSETCSAVADCQSGSDPCPGQICQEGSQSCVGCVVDADCDDGVYCNGAETCNAGTCQAGSAVNCNDGVGCTDDSCNESTDSCDNVANNANCDDGSYCNGVETCSATLDCQSGSAVNCDDGIGCTDDSCNESTDSCDNVTNDSNCDDGIYCNGAETCSAGSDCQSGSDPCPGQFCLEGSQSCADCLVDGDCDDGAFCNGSETCVAGSCSAGSDPCPGQTCNESTDQCETVAGAQLEADVVVANGTTQTVNLVNSYSSPVVVCSVQYAGNTTPVVPRVSNVTSNSFDLRLQSPSGNAVANDSVHFLVVEEGSWDVGGIKIDAWTYESTITAENNNWVAEAQTYGQSFTNPVVLGQVMSENDADWSIFWCRGNTRQNPPSGSALQTGKNVAEDPNVPRANETIGVIVFEAASSSLGAIDFEAALGADTIRGVGNAPPYNYSFNASFSGTPAVAIVTMAAMDGGNGGWAYLYG